MFSSIIGQGTAEHASWWLTEKRYRQLALKSQILLQVLVLQMQTKGSVEERILESSYQKRSLADRSITGKRLLTFCSLASCHSLEQLLVVSNISPRSVQHNPCCAQKALVRMQPWLNSMPQSLEVLPVLKQQSPGRDTAWVADAQQQADMHSDVCQVVSLMVRLEQMSGGSICWTSLSALPSRRPLILLCTPSPMMRCLPLLPASSSCSMLAASSSFWFCCYATAEIGSQCQARSVYHVLLPVHANNSLCKACVHLCVDTVLLDEVYRLQGSQAWPSHAVQADQVVQACGIALCVPLDV